MTAPSTTTIGATLLCVAIAASALAMGSIDTVVLEAIVGILVVATTFTFWRATPITVSRTVVLLVSCALTLIVFTAFQCMPLPLSVLTTVSPHSAGIWRSATAGIGSAVVYAPLSLDPTATRIQVLRGIAYALTFTTTIGLVQHGRGPIVRSTLVVSGVLLGAVSIVHILLNARAVYGFYRPRSGVSIITPFFNANHLAGYLVMGTLVAAGAAFDERVYLRRAALVISATALTGAVIALGSRGAVGTMVLGFFLLILIAKRRRPQILRALVPLTALFMALAAAVLAIRPLAIHTLSDTDTSKLHIALEVVRRMLPNYWLVGVGRGAFESSYPEFRAAGGYFVYTHPENIVAQWLSEWGVPIGLSALALITFALRPVRRVREQALGVWVAIAAAAMQNTVDFTLEIPAMVIAISTCAGLALGTQRTSRVDSAGQVTFQQRYIIVASWAVMIFGCLLVRGRGTELHAARDAIERAALEPDNHAFIRRLRRDVVEHPAEPYFPFMGAWQALRTGSNVLPFVELTLERAPVYPPAHLVLARYLRSRSPAQARFEYRTCLEQWGGYPVQPAEIAPLIGSFDDALEAAPRGPESVEWLDAFARLVGDRLPATAWRIDVEATVRNKGVIEPAVRRAESSVRALETHEAWCAPPGDCVVIAAQRATTVERLTPNRCTGFTQHARALRAAGDIDGALNVLRRADSVADRSPCVAVLADIAVAAGREDDATQAIDTMTRIGCANSATACVDSLLAAAQLDVQRHAINQAQTIARRALTVADNDNALERAADLASAIGLHVEAATAFKHLADRHRDAEFSARAQAEQARIRE